MVLIAAFIALSVLALGLVANLANFALPSSSTFKGLFTGTNPIFSRDSRLVISVQANLTSVSEGGILNHGYSSTRNFISRPLSEVEVFVTNGNNSKARLALHSNDLGLAAMDLPPGNYNVDLLDWRLAFASIRVDLRPGSVTTLMALINFTNYMVESYQVTEGYASGFSVGWEPLYLQITGSNTSPSSAAASYLVVNGTDAYSAILGGSSSGLVPLKLTLDFADSSSEWFSGHVAYPLTTQYLGKVQILSLNVTYLVSSI